jgi:acylphosphatase
VTVIRLVVIRGRVQGVGYRAWTEYTADGCGLEGWVRNRRDGSVEAVFAGHAQIVREMIDLCRQGPPGSRVDAIEEREATSDELDLRGGYRFALLPTL